MGNGKAGLITRPWSHLWLPQGAHNLTPGERSGQRAMSSRKAASNCCQINKKLRYSLGSSSKLEIDIQDDVLYSTLTLDVHFTGINPTQLDSDAKL